MGAGLVSRGRRRQAGPLLSPYPCARREGQGLAGALGRAPPIAVNKGTPGSERASQDAALASCLRRLGALGGSRCTPGSQGLSLEF